MLLSNIFGPSVVKYDLLRNNRHSKLHAVIDYLFFQLLSSGYNNNVRVADFKSPIDHKLELFSEGDDPR